VDLSSARWVVGSPASIALTPRLVVNSIRSAVASTVEGRGVTRGYRYQIARGEVDAGQLEILLGRRTNTSRCPCQLVRRRGRLRGAQVRAFVDFARETARPAFFRDSPDSRSS